MTDEEFDLRREPPQLAPFAHTSRLAFFERASYIAPMSPSTLRASAATAGFLAPLVMARFR